MKTSKALTFVKFNAVGAIGIVVQLAALAILRDGAGLHYLAATALAVEAAILHNFLWHMRWTWREATPNWNRREVQAALVRFHIGNGAVTLITNLVLMRLLVGALGMHYIAANILSIAAAGVANFVIGDRFVFVPSGGAPQPPSTTRE